jgi:hypothetical protein
VRTKGSQVDAWYRLNERQQKYLQAVYEVDQAKEAAVKSAGARGQWKRTPASEWRWMPFNAAGAALLQKIEDAAYRDEGTGSTFAALERRGLVLMKYKPGSVGAPILFVQITKAGRKLVREALHLKAQKTLPVGTLREWHWRTLCRAYVRGDQGMGYDKDTGDGFGYVSWNTCLRLRDYRIKGQDMALIREGRRGEPFALVITEFGKQFYCENWQHYHQMYPDVDAPEPQ